MLGRLQATVHGWASNASAKTLGSSTSVLSPAVVTHKETCLGDKDDLTHQSYTKTKATSSQLGFLPQECENHGAPSLLEPLDGILERAQVDPVQLFQCVPQLDARLLRNGKTDAARTRRQASNVWCVRRWQRPGEPAYAVTVVPASWTNHLPCEAERRLYYLREKRVRRGKELEGTE